VTRNRRSATTLFAALSISALLAMLGASWAASDSAEPGETHRYGDLVHIFTSDLDVPDGVVRHGAIVCVGGDVRIEGEVTQDVIVVLGSVTVDGGAVDGSLFGILSEVELRDAEIRGDLFNIAGGLRRDGVQVGGELFDFGLLGEWFPGFLSLWTWLRAIGLLMVFVLLVLLVAIAPDRVRRIAEETPVRYLSALLVGLLVYVALVLLVIPLVATTLIGLPILFLLWKILKWLAIAGIFLAIGRRIGRSFGREMSPLGAVLLVYAFYAGVLLLLGPLGLTGLVLIALFKTLFFVFVEAPAMGLVFLTRLGTRPHFARTSSPADWPGGPTGPGDPGVVGGPPRDPSADRSD
jgi:hypothetical protein